MASSVYSRLFTSPLVLNSSKKVRKLKFDWRFLSCYQLIFLAFGIIGKPCYSSLQWCAICYDYAIWGCAAHLNMGVGVGVKWNVPKCIAIVITLKTPRSDLTRKRVSWGQTHSWVRLIRNLSPKCLSDSDSGSVWPRFRVGLTPKWVWPPRTLFQVKSDPGVFRVIWQQQCILAHFTLHPPPYSGVLHIPKLCNHNKWHIIVKRNNRAFQWYQMQGKWVGNKSEIVSQTWVSELFLRSLYRGFHSGFSMGLCREPVQGGKFQKSKKRGLILSVKLQQNYKEKNMTTTINCYLNTT